MFHEESLGAHRQLFVLGRIEVVDLAAAKWVAVEQIHVYQHRQSVAVSLYAGEFLAGVAEFQSPCLEHFRGYEVGSAHNVGRIFAGHNKAVAVNHSGTSAFRVDEHVLVRQVGVGQAGGVKPADGAGYLQAHVIVSEPRAFLGRFQEFVAQFGRGEPFAFLLLAFEHSVAEEKMFLVSGAHYA